VDSPPSVKEMLGISDGDVERIRTAMAGGLEAAAEHVREEWVLPFVIAGSPDECTAEIEELFEQHQLDEFLLPVFNVEHAANLLRTVASILP